MTGWAAARTDGLDDPLMETFQSALSRPGIMSFGAGFMNPAGFDVSGVRAAFAAALGDDRAAATLQYGLAEGDAHLRDAIAGRMAALEVPAHPDEIVVTTGATQALDLVLRTLLDPGDVVLVERPTYVVALKQLALAQARVVSVAGDATGLDPAALEEAIITQRPKLIYAIPTFQNPGGMTMSAQRRQEVAALAERHGVWVIEDDPYRELRYGPAPPAPLTSLSRARVIYLGTLAKTVAPGLRVGWLLAPPEVIRRCRPVKQALDFHTSSVDQTAAAIYLERVDWGRRTAQLRAVYDAAMRAMLAGLPAALPEGSRFSRPGGGIFVWVTLPDGWSVQRLLELALAHGMFFMPGQAFLADVEDDSTLRLSISPHDPGAIAEGLGRLAAATVQLRDAAEVSLA